MREKPPVHLWIVGAIAVLWHLVAVFDYLATELRLESYMANFTEAQVEYFHGFPAWTVAAWAIAVWGGLAGSLGLLTRKGWAVWMFAASLAGLAVTTVYNFGLSDGAEIMGSGAVAFTGLIWAVAIGLFVYARRQAGTGVLE